VAAFTAAAISAVCNRTSGHCGVLSTTNGYFAAGEILLVLDILVSSNKNVEPRPLCFR
jgi:hypothetical protein